MLRRYLLHAAIIIALLFACDAYAKKPKKKEAVDKDGVPLSVPHCVIPPSVHWICTQRRVATLWKLTCVNKYYQRMEFIMPPRLL